MHRKRGAPRQFDEAVSGNDIECNVDSGYGYEVDVKMTMELGSAETNSRRSAWVSHSGRRTQGVESNWLQRFEAAYVIEAREWIQSVAHERPTGPSAWDGYMAIVVADACIESAKSGRLVRVEVPTTPEIYR